MSTESRYTVDAQLRYMKMWFMEWSEMQRGDFVTVLAQSFVSTACQVNGLADLSLRPPSLFQCRIKLFREWAPAWDASERQQFLESLREVDAQFIDRYELALQALEGGNKNHVNSQPPPMVTTDPREGEVV